MAGEEATKKERASEVVVKAPDKKLLRQGAVESKSKSSKLKLFLHMFPSWIYHVFYKRVLRYFKTVNRKAGKRIPMWFMKLETYEHVDSVVKVFKWVILPASLIYVVGIFCLIKEFTLDSALVGVLFFFYSNFLPDIPAIFRGKYPQGMEALNSRFPWYKNWVLLLFAPLFVVFFLCGKEIKWRTIVTFHNLKSLAVYTGFLLIVGLAIFASFPFGAGDALEGISLPLYGLAGYLTHLKVDLCI